MTRINLVPPSELCRQHLVAEYRELPRVFGLVKKAQARGLMPNNAGIPNEYVLGSGHVKFFYDKLNFLRRRQFELMSEMRTRGYKPNFNSPEELLDGIDAHWINDYDPTAEALLLNRKRIEEKTPLDARSRSTDA